MPLTWGRWWRTGKILVVPTLAAFLSFAYIVINPLNELTGQYAFLVHTSLLLFFFPTGGIANQIESTVLGIIANAFGLAWTNATLAIAAYCGRRYGADSAPANAVTGLGLASLSLIGGFVRSYAPRLTAASRCALFLPVFLLTGNTGIVAYRSSLFVHPFLITCFAAAFALVPVLMFSREQSSVHRLARLIHGSLETSSELFPLSLASVLKLDLEDRLNALHATREGAQDRMAKSLKNSAYALHDRYDEYLLEISRSRLSPLALQPLIKAVYSLHRNPLLGPTSHVPGERIQSALQRTYGTPSVPATPHTPRNRSTSRVKDLAKPSIDFRRDSASSSPISTRHAPHIFVFEPFEHRRSRSALHVSTNRPKMLTSSKNLVTAIQHSFSVASSRLSAIFGKEKEPTEPPSEEKQVTLVCVKEELENALSDLQRDLASLLDDLGAEVRGRPDSLDSQRYLLGAYDGLPNHPRDHFRLAFYMTALLDLAKDVLELINVVVTLSEQANDKRKWYLPRIPGFSRFRKRNGTSSGAVQDNDAEDDARIDKEMVRQDEEDFVYNQMDFATAKMYRSTVTPDNPDNWRDKIVLKWRKYWDDPRVVEGRIVLSRLLRGAKTSPHIYFAIKLAGGISLLSIPAWLSPNSAGRRWFDQTRGAWMVNSYMFVLETHTGAIFKIGLFRMLGTFVGSVAAYVCTVIAHRNAYALVTLATVLSIPTSYLILLTKYGPIGTVSGVTLPPLLFLEYLHQLDGQSNFELAWTRFVDIVIGIGSAVIVGCLIWPNHARVRYFKATSSSFEKATEYYLRMSRDLLRPSLVYQGDTKQYDRLEMELRNHVAASRSLVAIQKNEVSLLPRPIKLYSEVVDLQERLVEAFAEIRLLRFSVPRKTAVFDVMPLRREMISSILINLWALNQSFRSRSPLPQYLPSPRAALEGIMASMDELAKSSHRSHMSHADVSDGSSSSVHGKDQLGILYGMAENEAVAEVCTILEELVAAAGTLFGTKTFLGKSREPSSISEERANPYQ